MSAQIPLSTRPFFQEYNFLELNAKQHSNLIIERILAFGNREEIKWLFEQYGRANLVDWVRHDGVRLLPRRRYQLWCVLFDLIPEPRQPTAWTH